jgi:hypothetical protein
VSLLPPEITLNHLGCHVTNTLSNVMLIILDLHREVAGLESFNRVSVWLQTVNLPGERLTLVTCW